jgi:hypothetical protein
LSEARETHDLKGGGQFLLVIAGALVISVAVGVGYALTLLPEIRAKRMHGNERAAIQVLIRIKTAQTLYRERTDPTQATTKRYGDLEELEAAGQLETGLAGVPRQGYLFEVRPGSDPTRRWWGKASPQFPGKTGQRYYFVDQSGVVYVSEGDFQVPPPEGKLPAGVKPIGQ